MPPPGDPSLALLFPCARPHAPAEEDLQQLGKRKRKAKPVTAGVPMTEDEYEGGASPMAAARQPQRRTAGGGMAGPPRGSVADVGDDLVMPGGRERRKRKVRRRIAWRVSVCVCLCVCACVCACVCVCVCVCLSLSLCVYVCVRVHVRVHVLVCVENNAHYVQKCLYLRVHFCASAPTLACTPRSGALWRPGLGKPWACWSAPAMMWGRDWLDAAGLQDLLCICTRACERSLSCPSLCARSCGYPQMRDFGDDEYELPGKAAAAARAERGGIRGAAAAGGMGAAAGGADRRTSHKAGAGINARQNRCVGFSPRLPWATPTKCLRSHLHVRVYSPFVCTSILLPCMGCVPVWPHGRLVRGMHRQAPHDLSSIACTCVCVGGCACACVCACLQTFVVLLAGWPECRGAAAAGTLSHSTDR